MSLRFKVAVEVDEDGCFCVTVPALPGCVSAGDTMEQALANIKEAIELHLEVLEEFGDVPPGATFQEVLV